MTGSPPSHGLPVLTLSVCLVWGCAKESGEGLCSVDSDGDGLCDIDDPTPFGFEGPLDRESPLSMQLHLHGSLSEKDGTMAYHTTQAEKYGLDLIWWSDHDTMIMMFDRPGGYDFDGGDFTEEVSVFGGEATHGVACEANGLDDTVSEVLEGGPSDSGYYWHIAGHSSGGDSWSRSAFKYEGGGYQLHHLPLMADATASIAIRPHRQQGSDWEFRFVVELSGNQAGTTNTISYYISGEDLAATSTADALFIPIEAEVDEWSTLTFPLTHDALHFAEAEDQGAHGFSFQIAARYGAEVAIDIDDIQLSWEIEGEELLQRQREILAERYSDGHVTHFVGHEITAVIDGQHVNGLQLGLPMHTYPDHELLKVADAVAHAQQFGGVAMCNHPLGRATVDLPEGDAAITWVMQYLEDIWLPKGGFGCDAVEVGYLKRGVDLEYHLMFWDLLAAAGITTTGVGTSDNHVAADWADGINPFVTWIFADVPIGEDVADKIQRGRAFFGNPFAFLGEQPLLDLWSEHGAVMGQAFAGDLDHVIHVEVGYHEPGWQLALIVDGDVQETTLLDGSPDEIVYAVVRSAAALQFVRAELLDDEGERVLVSNPIYLVDDAATVPDHRRAN